MTAKKVTAETVMAHFKLAAEAKADWLSEAKEDMEFAAGKQWSDNDKAELYAAGVQALTINKIKPKLNLLTGIESQNRTDFVAYPEGQEDSVKADIATALLKNMMKASRGNYKISELFELACQIGEGFIEPYMDYTYDVVNGALRWRVYAPDCIFADPGAVEYDLSDARYICKLTRDLTRDEVTALFPDAEEALKDVRAYRIDPATWTTVDRKGYTEKTNDYTASAASDAPGVIEEELFDVVEYYYKKPMRKTYVIDLLLKKMTQAADQDRARQFVDQANAEKPGSARMYTRMEPEIWKAAVCGPVLIDDARAWSYPAYKSYPIFPLYAYRTPVRMAESKYTVQGVARALKDLNREFNKRRTQELRLLNSTANSGWQYEEGTLTPPQEDVYRKYGSAAGVLLVHAKGKLPPQRITPAPLSQGHAQLAAETNQDIKESSGINDDLLAMNEGQSSGRAIMLRQKQGLVMVQKLFDNLSQTKQGIGKFLLTQLGTVYATETAIRVLGQRWCEETFAQPVMGQAMDPATGQVVAVPQVDPRTGQPAVTFDQQACASAVNEVLADTEMGTYDVAVGEGASSETVRFANYLTIKDLAAAGIPIPPDIIVDESTLSTASKERIKKEIAAMQQRGAAPGRPAN